MFGRWGFAELPWIVAERVGFEPTEAQSATEAFGWRREWDSNPLTQSATEAFVAERVGIRTHVRLSPKHAFQACAFNHSAISPRLSLDFTIGPQWDSRGRRRWLRRSGLLGEAAFGPGFELIGGEADADVEGAEVGVEGAGLVEAHLVDELLEDGGIVGEEIDAPFPVVESDGAGDDLADAVRRNGGRSCCGRA